MKKIETILAIDFGTTKVHTNIIDVSNGHIVSGGNALYQYIHPYEGWAEINPEKIWEASQDAVANVIDKSDKNVSIKGIAFSYFGDNIVPVDKNGVSLYNMILQFDCRASQEAQIFRENLGDDKFIDITGGPIWPECSSLKILWLKNNRKEIFNNTRYFLNIQQYINMRLGIGIITDNTMASRKMAYDIKKKEWSKEIISLIGIEPDMLGNDIRLSTDVCCKIKRYGRVVLPYEIPVILGAHDSECGLIGLGISPNGNKLLGNSTGTFDHLGFFINEYINTFKQSKIISWRGPLEKDYVVMAGYIAGPNLDWFIKNLNPQKDSNAINRLFEQLEFDGTNKMYLMRGIHTGNGGLTGINVASSLEDIFKAIVEGITFSLKTFIEDLTKINGDKFRRIRIGGGGAKSDKWLQLKANVFDIPIEKVCNMEISSVGAAILAAKSLAVYDSLNEAMNQMISVEKKFNPDPTAKERYGERFNEFVKIKENCYKMNQTKGESGYE